MAYIISFAVEPDESRHVMCSLSYLNLHALSKRAMIETTALARGLHSRKSVVLVLRGQCSWFGQMNT
jgi:hypothetical protein